MSFVAKAVKGIFRGIKKVVSGITKVFKKVIKSPIGKALLIGGAVYLGGGVLGAWKTPFSTISKANTWLSQATGGTVTDLGGGAASDLIGSQAANEQGLPGINTTVGQATNAPVKAGLTQTVQNAEDLGLANAMQLDPARNTASLDGGGTPTPPGDPDPTESAFMKGVGTAVKLAPLIAPVIKAVGAGLAESPADAETRKEIALRDDAESRQHRYAAADVGAPSPNGTGLNRLSSGGPVYSKAGILNINSAGGNVTPEAVAQTGLVSGSQSTGYDETGQDIATQTT